MVIKHKIIIRSSIVNVKYVNLKETKSKIGAFIWSAVSSRQTFELLFNFLKYNICKCLFSNNSSVTLHLSV